MADFDFSKVIAARHFNSGAGGKVSVYVWAPEPAPDQVDEYTCAYGIDGVQVKPVRRRAHGIDAFQALILAMRSVRLYLEDFHEETGQELYWLDQSELHGFENIVSPDVS